MNPISISMVACSLMVAAITSCQFTVGNKTAEKYVMEDEAHIPQISFNSNNVVDTFYYGDVEYNEDNVYYIVYDNIDAALEYAAIRVDMATYLAVNSAVENGVELDGWLVAYRKADNVEYIYTEE